MTTVEPYKRGGRACVRGLRIAVADVLGWLASGMSHDEILSDFPELTEADIRACLAYAADRENHGVWAAAREGGFTLVTQDADLTRMAALIGPPPQIVWLRCGHRPSGIIADLIRRNAKTIEALARDDRVACLEIV